MSTDAEKPRPPKRNSPPGKQQITREKYDALLDAFREEGENFRAVSARCGVHWETAKRGWHQGWSDQKSKPWALPIKAVIQREQIEARAALERERKNLVNDQRIARQQSLQKAIEDSFVHIVDSRAKRGRVILGARDSSIAALIVSQKLLKAAIPLADKVTHALETEDMDVFQRMRLLRQLGRFAHDAIEMAQVVDEMERKALGEPDAILEVQHGVHMTIDEAKATLQDLAEVLHDYDAGADMDEVIEAEWVDRDQLAAIRGNTEGGTTDDDDDDQPTDMARERGDA